MLGIIVATAIMMAQGSAYSAGYGVQAAQAWVRLIDAKRYDESWSSAGAIFRAQIPQVRWPVTVQPVREPLGPVVSRSVRKVTDTSSLPGVPDGNYEVVEFTTKFVAKADATETVVLANEGGTWKVNGYFVR